MGEGLQLYFSLGSSRGMKKWIVWGYHVVQRTLIATVKRRKYNWTLLSANIADQWSWTPLNTATIGPIIQQGSVTPFKPCDDKWNLYLTWNGVGIAHIIWKLSYSVEDQYKAIIADCSIDCFRRWSTGLNSQQASTGIRSLFYWDSCVVSRVVSRANWLVMNEVSK